MLVLLFTPIIKENKGGREILHVNTFCISTVSNSRNILEFSISGARWNKKANSPGNQVECGLLEPVISAVVLKWGLLKCG